MKFLIHLVLALGALIFAPLAAMAETYPPELTERMASIQLATGCTELKPALSGSGEVMFWTGSCDSSKDQSGGGVDAFTVGYVFHKTGKMVLNESEARRALDEIQVSQ